MMAVAMFDLSGRVHVHVGGRPVHHTLQPAAEESGCRQCRARGQLPPEVKQGDCTEDYPRAWHDLGPR